MMKFVLTRQSNMLPKPLDESVKLHLHRVLSTLSDRHDHGRVHASDLTNQETEFCAREFALLHATGGKRHQHFLGTADAVTFRHGRNMQDAVVGWLGDMVVGGWWCVSCGNEVSWSTRPAHCGKCGVKRFDYVEPRFVAPEVDITAGIDVLVNFNQPKLRVVEIKTIDKDEFKALKMPYGEHRLRTALYLRVVANAGKLAVERVYTDWGLVLYICKGYGFADEAVAAYPFRDRKFSPFKEFKVVRDDASTEQAWKRAAMVASYKTKGLMPKPICPTSLIKRAKFCPVVAACFSGKYPPSS